MAKHHKLIPDEGSNWEVAAFLLIDHLYVTDPQMSHIRFTRADAHTSTAALTFIDKLLRPMGHELDNTPSNSISSAITRLEQDGYLTYDGDDCVLTSEGRDRLQEIVAKYDEDNHQAINMEGEVIDYLNNMSPEEEAKLKERLKAALNKDKTSE